MTVRTRLMILTILGLVVTMAVWGWPSFRISSRCTEGARRSGALWAKERRSSSVSPRLRKRLRTSLLSPTHSG